MTKRGIYLNKCGHITLGEVSMWPFHLDMYIQLVVI